MRCTLLVGAPVDPALAARGLRRQDHRPAGAAGGTALDVLLRRPDVLRPSIRCASANANIGAARAAFFPTISLTGNVGSASQQLSGLFKSGTGAWTFTPTVTLPMFHGGEMVGNLAARTRQSRDRARAVREGDSERFREVADALALTATLERQRAAQEALVAATERAYELSQQRYKAGRDSYLDVLDLAAQLLLGAAGI